MKLKRFLISLAFAGALMPAIAQTEGNYLHVRTADGWKVLDLDKVDRLTFAGGVMTATDKENKVVDTFKQDALETMVFSESTALSGIKGVAADEKAAFVYDAASQVVKMLKDGNFEVYAASGEKIVSIAGVKSGETVDVSALSSGVVVMKSGSYSFKTIVK